LRIIALLLGSFFLLYGGEYELRLYEKILPILYGTRTLKVFPDHTTQNDLQKSTILKVVPNCYDADVLIGKRFHNLHNGCETKPIFATSYKSYKNHKTVIGAFYWRKGRPQISFKKENIQKFNLFLPDSLKRYAQ